MDAQPSPTRRNPETHARHRRELTWQVYLPLGIGVFVVLLLGVLSGGTSAATASKWADTSLIFLSALTCLPLLLLLALVAGLAYGVWAANQNLPGLMYRIQQGFLSLSRITRQTSDRIAAPFIKAQQVRTSLKALKKSIRGENRTTSQTPKRP